MGLTHVTGTAVQPIPNGVAKRLAKVLSKNQPLYDRVLDVFQNGQNLCCLEGKTSSQQQKEHIKDKMKQEGLESDDLKLNRMLLEILCDAATLYELRARAISEAGNLGCGFDITMRSLGFDGSTRTLLERARLVNGAIGACSEKNTSTGHSRNGEELEMLLYRLNHIPSFLLRGYRVDVCSGTVDGIKLRFGLRSIFNTPIDSPDSGHRIVCHMPLGEERKLRRLFKKTPDIVDRLVACWNADHRLSREEFAEMWQRYKTAVAEAVYDVYFSKYEKASLKSMIHAFVLDGYGSGSIIERIRLLKQLAREFKQPVIKYYNKSLTVESALMTLRVECEKLEMDRAKLKWRSVRIIGETITPDKEVLVPSGREIYIKPMGGGRNEAGHWRLAPPKTVYVPDPSRSFNDIHLELGLNWSRVFAATLKMVTPFVVVASLYASGYPPPQRFLFPSQRIEIAEQMRQLEDRDIKAYLGKSIGDGYLPEWIVRKRAEILAAEAKYRANR